MFPQDSVAIEAGATDVGAPANTGDDADQEAGDPEALAEGNTGLEASAPAQETGDLEASPPAEETGDFVPAEETDNLQAPAQEIANLEAKVKNIKSSNSLHEVKISILQKHDKNTDLVDEQIRNVLGYGKNNEFVIFFDN